MNTKSRGIGRRPVLTPAIAIAIAMIAPAVASAHARVSPAVSLSGKLQLYSLAVPTEKSGLTTTKIVMTVPNGFGIDSLVPPPPGWHQVIQQTGSGDSAVITKVTWTGGSTPTGEDSLFQFLAQPASAQSYTFGVEQTYSDESIVNWSGPESSARGRSVAALACAAIGLLAPSTASAHAYLIKTVPAASGILNAPPPNVQLTYDEAVEPRFAIVSVTNAAGQQETTAAVSRSPANPDTLVVPLRPHLPEGWYLIYWRAISVDGHPVQGAFTYAVGPNPGPAPQFKIPNIAAGATSPQLLITRWVMFLSVMIAIGLFAFRIAIARPLVCRVPAPRLRAVSIAFVIASVIGLIAIPVYLDFAIANDSLRSVFDLGALVTLYRVTAFGRAYVDMILCFGLFCVTAWTALWLDRPAAETRSIAELVATTGAVLAAAAVLMIPGAAGHAAQTSPRGYSLLFDWLHLTSGSLWLGGLVGLLVLWFTIGSNLRVPALSTVVPRVSTVAFVSVLVLLGTGTGATIFHMPAINGLWETGYGVAILVKIGILAAALCLAAGNLLRVKPRLAAARDRPELAGGGARLLRVLIGGEAILVAGAVFVAAVLSSLAPPPPAFALQNSALAQVGPGRVAATVKRGGYVLQVLVSPNQAAAPDSFTLRITRNGQPVRRANVTLTFNHLEMQMPQQEYQLTETQPGLYFRAAPALIMVGKWSLAFQVTPNGAPPFTALIVDQANG